MLYARMGMLICNIDFHRRQCLKNASAVLLGLSNRSLAKGLGVITLIWELV